MLRTISIPLLLAVSLALWSPAVQAQEPEPAELESTPWFCNHVHITVEGGPSPFLAVQYAVRVFDQGALAIQTKQYPLVPVYDNRVALLPKADAERLLRKLWKADALTLRDAAADAPMGLAYRVEIGYDGKTNTFLVQAPELLDDGRYASIVELVRDTVERATGPAYFRDLLVSEEELGLLNLRTFPPAEVEIDGVPLGKASPVFGLELRPGVHVVTLKASENNAVRRVKFSIHKGKVTNLNLNLK
jgi:hypothetical protein